MVVEINILKDKRKKIIKEHQLEKKRDKVAYMVLVVCLGLFMVLQVSQLVMSVLVKNQEKQLAKRQAEVARYKQVESDGAEVVRRLGEVERLVGNRQDVGSRLSLLFKIFNSGTKLKSVEFGGVTSGQGLLVSGTAETVYEYINFNDQLVKLAQDQDFETVEQGSLTRGQEADYQFSYKITTGNK